MKEEVEELKKTITTTKNKEKRKNMQRLRLEALDN